MKIVEKELRKRIDMIEVEKRWKRLGMKEGLIKKEEKEMEINGGLIEK